MFSNPMRNTFGHKIIKQMMQKYPMKHSIILRVQAKSNENKNPFNLNVLLSNAIGIIVIAIVVIIIMAAKTKADLAVLSIIKRSAA